MESKKKNMISSATDEPSGKHNACIVFRVWTSADRSHIRHGTVGTTLYYEQHVFRSNGFIIIGIDKNYVSCIAFNSTKRPQRKDAGVLFCSPSM